MSVQAYTSVGQWQYLRVYIAANAAGRYAVNSTSLGSEPAENSTIRNNMDADEALVQLGDDGWELVGAVGDASQFHLFFKRPQ